MTPGSLAAIARRIEETGRPDIVLFDYARLYWWRETMRNQLGHLLAQTGPDVFTIEDRPELLELLMVVWNKAHRRDFVTAGGFHFPPGYYEDTPWTYPTMLSAKSIAVLDRVCIHYRQRREAGNILKSRSRRHFEIFDQWDLVWAFLDEHPELQKWRPLMMRRELQHTTTILNNARRLFSDDRREFFRAAHEHYLANRPAERVPMPDGIAGVEVGFIMRNRYHVYNGLQLARRLVARLRGLAGAMRRRGGRYARITVLVALRLYYRLQLRLPIDDKLAVYSSYWNRSVSCNPYAVYLKATELAPDIRGVWIIRDPETTDLPAGFDYVRPDSLAYYRVVARAKFFVSNTNFQEAVRKRRGTVHLQTQHGTPLKKMGLDLLDYPVGANRMNFARLLRRVDKWDFNISSNAYSTEAWERSNPAAYETLEVGLPRNDRLVRSEPGEQREIREKLGLPTESRRVVLYAPTFRDYRNDFKPEVNLAALVDAIGEDSVLLMRAHYFNDETTREALRGHTRSGRVRDMTAYPSVEDLYIAADVLLTDYSSAMFDYALLDRPIVIYAYDWDTYVRTRGVNFDLLAQPPGFVATTAEELLEGFRSGEVWGESAAKARADFRARFCQYDDGFASERVVRRVFLGEKLPARMESDSTSVTSEASDARETEPPTLPEDADRETV
jgi:CDP-glycerol glycerophosphotransferase